MVFIFPSCFFHVAKLSGIDYTLAEDSTILNIFSVSKPDKSDVFIGYATVAGYKAFSGDKDGSVYLQTLAKGLTK